MPLYFEDGISAAILMLMLLATAATRQAIYAFNIYIPFVLFLVMFVCAMKFDLEAKMPAIKEELEKLKAQK